MIRIDVNSTHRGEGKTFVCQKIEEALSDRTRPIIYIEATPDGEAFLKSIEDEDNDGVVVITDGGYHPDSLKELTHLQEAEAIKHGEEAPIIIQSSDRSLEEAGEHPCKMLAVLASIDALEEEEQQRVVKALACLFPGRKP